MVSREFRRLVWIFPANFAERGRNGVQAARLFKQEINESFGIKGGIVTHNGVDTFLFYSDAKQKKFDLPECYVLFVGSLESRKNLDLLLRSWDGIKNDFKETWLIIVGASGNVFKAVNFSHEPERIRFVGYVEDEVLAGL